MINKRYELSNSRDWSSTDINITKDGIVIMEAGEPILVKPRTIIITEPEGYTISLEELFRFLRNWED